MLMRRKLCGVLNKITDSNFESMSDRIVPLAVSVERSENSELLDTFVRMIFQRGLSDTRFTDVYVNLCQKIVDELEGERSQWRRVDLFHIGNPMVCFETSLRVLSQYEFDRIVDSGDLETLLIFSKFVGGLFTEGVLYVSDVQSILDDLFARARYSNGHSVAIRRFLSPVLDAFNASQFLDLLAIFPRVENILQEGKISSMTRYIMMHLHDEILYPQPQDAFSSSRQRIEVYGLDVDDSDLESADDLQEDLARILRACDEQARYTIFRRDFIRGVRFFQELRVDDRHLFVSSLLSIVFSSGGFDDAAFIAGLFSRDAIRDLCRYGDAFIEGFGPSMADLEDICLDVPDAYPMMALMVHSSALSTSVVTDLASLIRPTTSSSSNPRERFLEAYSFAALKSESAVQSSVEEEADD